MTPKSVFRAQGEEVSRTEMPRDPPIYSRSSKMTEKSRSTSVGVDQEKSTARTGIPTLRALPILPASATDTSIAKALADRGIPKSVYDFIEYNLGKGAAVVAILTGEMRHHNHIPGEACSCA